MLLLSCFIPCVSHCLAKGEEHKNFPSSNGLIPYMNSGLFTYWGIPPPITHPRLVMTTYHNFMTTYHDNLKGWIHKEKGSGLQCLTHRHSAGIFTVRNNWPGFWKSLFWTPECVYMNKVVPQILGSGHNWVCPLISTHDWVINVAMLVSMPQLIQSQPALQLCPVVYKEIWLFL